MDEPNSWAQSFKEGKYMWALFVRLETASQSSLTTKSVTLLVVFYEGLPIFLRWEIKKFRATVTSADIAPAMLDDGLGSYNQQELFQPGSI